MKVTPVLTAALALLFAYSPDARAIVIDFDIDNGYAVGNLHGQPGTSGSSQWKTPAAQASSGVISVVDGVGTDGSQAIVANSHATLTSTSYFLKITDQDLGDLFDAGSTKINFSFALKWDAITSYANQGRFYVGGNSQDGFNGDVLRIAWMSDGSMIYGVGNPGGSSLFRTVLNSSGGTFRAVANTFYTVEGVIDYATKTYTLTINAVDQKDATGGLNLGFYDHAGSQMNANIMLMSLNNQTANYRPWVMDDLKMEAIPEPGSVALAGSMLLGLAGMRWFRSRRTDKMMAR